MIFITNSFSPLMFESLPLDHSTYEVSFEEFKSMIPEAESYVQHYDVAELLGVPVNTRPLRVRAGDIILEALLQRNGSLRCFVIPIRDCDKPLTRTYETTEEMA